MYIINRYELFEQPFSKKTTPSNRWSRPDYEMEFFSMSTKLIWQINWKSNVFFEIFVWYMYCNGSKAKNPVLKLIYKNYN